jgi:predicted ATPase
MAPATASILTSIARRRELPTLVGRERELDLLNNMLDALFNGRGRMVFIDGEAGMGKSRVAAETTERAARLGALTLWGTAYANETQIPFSMFASALEGLATRVTADELVNLLGDSATHLAGISPTITRTLSLTQAAWVSGDELRSIVAPMRRFLLRLAASSPVMIVLDGIHAADDRSLELLLDLADVVSSAAVLFFVTVAPHAVARGSMVRAACEQLRHDPATVCLELNGLSIQDTRLLLTGILGGSIEHTLLEAIHGLARGNPYYTEESVRALRGRDQLFQQDGVWHICSRTLAEWNRDQLRQPSHTVGDRELKADSRSA